LLKLYTGYAAQSTLGKKLGNQYTGPFKVLDKVGLLAYWLDFPKDWRLHPVVSIAHLEKYHDKDLFNRKPEEPGPVHIEGDTDKYKLYEVEKVIAKWMLPKKGKRAVRTEYLIKWKGYDDQWN
jgi:hypothetical protein